MEPGFDQPLEYLMDSKDGVGTGFPDQAQSLEFWCFSFWLLRVSSQLLVAFLGALILIGNMAANSSYILSFSFFPH